MKYLLIEPVSEQSGTVREVFDDKEQAMIWIETNGDKPEYKGWVIHPQDDCVKIN